MGFPEVGETAPAFTFADQDGTKVLLRDFKGETLVLVYFYPKSLTPG